MAMSYWTAFFLSDTSSCLSLSSDFVRMHATRLFIAQPHLHSDLQRPLQFIIDRGFVIHWAFFS